MLGLRFGSEEDLPVERTPSHLEPIEITPEPNGYKRPRMETGLESIRSMVYELVDIILQDQKLKKSFQVYYSKVESLCKLKYSEQQKLADVIFEKLKRTMTEVVVPEINTIILLESPLFEHAYIGIYNEWEAKLKLLSKLYLYLDRSYLMNPKRKRLFIQGLDLFRQLLLIDSPTASTTFKRYFTLLEGSREFGLNLEISREFTTMLVKLDYDNSLVLHNRLTEQVLRHFNQMKDTYTAEEYFRTVFTKISNEVEFFHGCGKDETFLKDLLLKLQWNLIFSDFAEHLKPAFPGLLAEENGDLQTLYDICNTSMASFQYNSILVILHEWSQVVNKTVIEIVDQQKLNKNLVILLVDEYSRCTVIIKKCFSGNDKFEFELRDSFSKALNNKLQNLVVLNHLSKYCDLYLKKTDDVEFSYFLSNILTLFKLIINKQDFLTRYKKDLSKRLLLYGKSDVDQEKRLVAPLLEIVGECDLADGIEAMFEDMNLLQNSYNEFVISESFTPMVLSKKYWPDIPKMYADKIVLPNQFATMLDEFTVRYQTSNEKFKNQLLDWSNYSLHQVVMNVTFSSGVKEVSLNLFQAVVLVAFEDEATRTLQEIGDITKIDQKFLIKILNSLTDKYKLLVTSGTEYAFNYNFTDRSNKIKVPGVKEIKETGKIDAVDKEVLRNRKSEFESTIVKICKKHKRISSVNLFNEAMQYLSKKGPVEIKDLKVTVDYLIDHEYLRRVTTEMFEYVS